MHRLRAPFSSTLLGHHHEEVLLDEWGEVLARPMAFCHSVVAVMLGAATSKGMGFINDWVPLLLFQMRAACQDMLKSQFDAGIFEMSTAPASICFWYEYLLLTRRHDGISAYYA